MMDIMMKVISRKYLNKFEKSCELHVLVMMRIITFLYFLYSINFSFHHEHYLRSEELSIP